MQMEDNQHERYKKAWETRRRNGTDKGWKCSGAGHKAFLTAMKNGSNWGLTSETAKRIAQEKIKNGWDLSEIVKRGIETKRKLGKKVGFNSEEIKKRWENEKNNPNFGMRGKHHSDETKRKMKISFMNNKIKNGKFAWPQIGKHEKELLDLQEQKDNCKILRQKHIIGYVVDGYCPKNNNVYEIYEKYHNKQRAKDLIREANIVKHLNCNFIKIWDAENNPTYCNLKEVRDKNYE
jgi:very-short-patch-repair endonuclease